MPWTSTARPASGSGTPVAPSRVLVSASTTPSAALSRRPAATSFARSVKLRLPVPRTARAPSSAPADSMRMVTVSMTASTTTAWDTGIVLRPSVWALRTVKFQIPVFGIPKTTVCLTGPICIGASAVRAVGAFRMQKAAYRSSHLHNFISILITARRA